MRRVHICAPNVWALRKENVDFAYPIFGPYFMYCAPNLRLLPPPLVHMTFFSGVGIATMVMVTYYNIYYCVIVAWSLYYFVASFVSIPDLPWNTCGKLVS